MFRCADAFQTKNISVLLIIFIFSIGIAIEAFGQSDQYLDQEKLATVDAERAYVFNLAKSIGLPLHLSESVKRSANLSARPAGNQRVYTLFTEADVMQRKDFSENVHTQVVALAEQYQPESTQHQITGLPLSKRLQSDEIKQRILAQTWLWVMFGVGIIILIGSVLFSLWLLRSHRKLAIAHKQLQQVQKNQQAILEAIPDLILELGLDGRYYDCYTIYSDLRMAPTEGLIGKLVSDVMPKDVSAIFLSALSDAYEKGKSASKEYVLQVSQGMCWFELFITRKIVAQGSDPRFVAIIRDITTHKLLEKMLLDKEQHFRTLAENSPDNIGRYDLQCRIFYVNPTLEKTLGLSALALLGKTPLEADANFNEYQAKIEAVIRTGQDDEIWLTLPDIGGSERYHHIRFVAERELAGRVIGVLAIGRDFTEQKRLEQALLRREHEFSTLAESTSNVIVRYDLDCRRIFVNRTYLQVHHHHQVHHSLEVHHNSTHVALGSTPLEFWRVLSHTADEYMAHLKRTMETGKSEVLLFSILDQNEQVVYYATSIVPEFNSDGLVVGVISIGHDVTHIHRMEAKLRKSELEFRTLAENSPEMILRYDCHCRRIYINPAYEKLTSIPINDALNKAPEDIWVADMPYQEYVMRIQQVMSTGEPDHILLEWQGVDGIMVSHLMHAVAEYSEQGDPIGVLVIGHNITKLKEIERQLKGAQSMLRKLAERTEAVRDDERKMLAREVHDELGQYIASLRMGVSAIDLQFGGDNLVLHEKTSRLLTLADSTINIVRNVVASLRPVSLDMGVVSALEWLVGEFQDRNEIFCSFHVHVRDEDIYLDDKRATAVFRIVQESLTNISRHAEASQVDISLEKHDWQYLLQVRDNGKGFDLNLRKDQSFGLVGMQERAYLLGGKLEVFSELEVGTTIKVYIPVNDL